MVAVVGVPRSGTSWAAGLARILGHQIPGPTQYHECAKSETGWLRRLDPSQPWRNVLHYADHLNHLEPDRPVVWKDPTAAPAAHLINWDRWTVIEVRRGPEQVADSELRWLPEQPRTRTQIVTQHREWTAMLADTLPPDRLVLDFPILRRLPARRGLEAVAAHIGVTVTRQHRDMARRFVAAQSYACPLGGCPSC